MSYHAKKKRAKKQNKGNKPRKTTHNVVANNDKVSIPKSITIIDLGN